MDGEQFSSQPRSRSLVAEIATAVGVAVIVGSAVVVVGMNRGEDPDRSLTAGPSAQTRSPTVTASVEETDSPESTPSESPPEETGATATAKVTKVDLSVDPADYIGPCPVTVTISASIFTDTGPVTARYRWLRAGEPGIEETVRFGGPGPQRVTVTDSLEAVDDFAASESLRVSAPNEVEADPVDIVVTCTPIAETWLDMDSASPAVCPYTITFKGSITVPHGPMTVTYLWERSDGANAPTQTLDFPAGGEQTMEVPANTWAVSPPGTNEFKQRIKILEPYEVTSNWSTFTLTCP